MRPLLICVLLALATPAHAAETSPQGAIAGFWHWWAKVQPQYVAAVGKEMPSKLIEDLSVEVAKISPDLGWEFGAGTSKQHELTVISEGNPALRMLGERWVAAAPDDTTFEFHATRQPSARGELMGESIALQEFDVPFDFERARITYKEDADLLKLNVTVHHPAIRKLPEEAAGFLSLLALDAAIGEAAVERWIGGVELRKSGAKAGLTLVQFAELVDALAVKWPPGTDVWAVGQGADPKTGNPLIFLVNRGLKRWDSPTHDTLCTATMAYRGSDNGLPSAEQKKTLDALEDALVARGGAGASFRGHRLGANELRAHLYVDGVGPLPKALSTWLAGRDANARIVCEPDPGWEKTPG